MTGRARPRVLSFFGTRPEAIKMAPVLERLRESGHFVSALCATGQHSQMLDQVLDLLGVERQFDLKIMRERQSLSELTSAVLAGATRVIAEFRPDYVLVHGDTTSSFAGALAAFYAHVPVGHVEAGLRTHDLQAPWPEEFNRCAVDLVADRMWAPTERAARNLAREGADPARVRVTGNTVVDALLAARKVVARESGLRDRFEQALPFLDPSRRLILVTGHRRESFGADLEGICRAIARLCRRGDVQAVWPVHLNPSVSGTVRTILGNAPGVHLTAPLNYFDFVQAMERSFLIVTDSGGVQEEAPCLRKPVLVTRRLTERPEAVDAGVARVVGADEDTIVAHASRLLDDPEHYAAMTRGADVYGDGRAAERIVDDLAALVGLEAVR